MANRDHIAYADTIIVIILFYLLNIQIATGWVAQKIQIDVQKEVIRIRYNIIDLITEADAE